MAQLIESDGPGGAESVVLALADGLRRRGAEVFPVGFSGGEGWLSGRLRLAGHAVFQPKISRTAPIDLTLLWAMVRWVTRNKIDILHAHELTMGVYAGAVGALTRVPHIVTMHGGTYYASAPRRARALRWSATRASSLVGVAESTCEHLASNLHISRSTIELVPNGVEHRPGSREKGRLSLGIGSSTKLLLAVGNLYAVKGHASLVAAAKLLAQRQDLPPWTIAIAGRGDEEQSLRSQIAAADLTSRVQLLGLRSDIPDLLAAADAWVMPSLSEGLPMALLEAMMAGCPTLCTSVGGIPDLIESGVSGWLVKPNEPEALAKAMATILSNADTAAQVGERGRSLAVGRYGVELMIDRYLALYEKSR
ncbi:MAG: glycosyltransferase family 4 protein [Gemmatimonas sp.]|nr:glycosyltransferase family 4 protein [Gemmatimonas sp.]